MRLLLIAALAAGPVLAADSPFLKGATLDAEVASRCSEGCVVFNPNDAEALMQAINAQVQMREAAAFDAGKQASDQTCRNRI